MSSKGEYLFSWISLLLVLLALCLTGTFNSWIAFIAPNPPLGWSILVAVIITDLFRARLKALQESAVSNLYDAISDLYELKEWEKIRVKGKLYYVIVGGPMLAILVLATMVILLQTTGQLGEYGKLNLYTFACDVAIFAAFYGIRIRGWEMREEKYRSSIRAKNGV
jgi:hypothetical protein